MKKLLLILICLFVSTDVLGKDKFVGKKILCGHGWENLTQFIFLKDNKVVERTVKISSIYEDVITDKFEKTYFIDNEFIIISNDNLNMIKSYLNDPYGSPMKFGTSIIEKKTLKRFETNNFIDYCHVTKENFEKIIDESKKITGRENQKLFSQGGINLSESEYNLVYNRDPKYLCKYKNHTGLNFLNKDESKVTKFRGLNNGKLEFFGDIVKLRNIINSKFDKNNYLHQSFEDIGVGIYFTNLDTKVEQRFSCKLKLNKVSQKLDNILYCDDKFRTFKFNIDTNNFMYTYHAGNVVTGSSDSLIIGHGKCEVF